MGDLEKATDKKDSNGNEGIRLKYVRIFLGACNVAFVIPLLVIACLNVPSADDFSMAYEVHETYLQSGSVLLSVLKAFYMGFWYYMNWTGYFFSDALTALAPHVFGEKLYFLGTWGVILMYTAGVWFFFRQLLRKVFRVGKHLTGCITSVVYFLLLHCMPEGNARCESFFWYSGAINYMFMFGLALLWLGALITVIADKKEKNYPIILLTIWGFLMGGANYMTALSLAIVSGSGLFIIGLNKIAETVSDEKREKLQSYSIVRICNNLSGVKKVTIPLVFMIIGMLVSAFAPGNKYRPQSNGFGPVKAIMVSLYYTLEHMLGAWITWPVICLLVILMIFVWKAVGRIGKFYHFGHPALFSAFCFLLAAANVTPPLFAMGNIEAGRIEGIYYMQSMLLLVLMLSYDCGFVRCVNKRRRQKQNPENERMTPMELLYAVRLGKTASKILVSLTAIFILGSIISVKVNPYFYTGTAALADMENGSARVYKGEFEERLKALKSEKVDDVELSSFSVRPVLLFYSDITTDRKDWLNKAVAEYYHKESVRLKED